MRERMHLPDEATAWHQLILEIDPTNQHSLLALARIESVARAMTGETNRCLSWNPDYAT